MAPRGKTVKSVEKKQEVLAAVPVYQPKTAISIKDKKTLRKGVEEYWQKEAEHYGWEDPPPENVVRRLTAITEAVDQETADLAVKRARVTVEIMLLGAWGKGTIPGPTTAYGLERDIKAAESLARMLEAKDLPAGRQWDRAAKLRQTLEELFDHPC